MGFGYMLESCLLGYVTGFWGFKCLIKMKSFMMRHMGEEGFLLCSLNFSFLLISYQKRVEILNFCEILEYIANKKSGCVNLDSVMEHLYLDCRGDSMSLVLKSPRQQ